MAESSHGSEQTKRAQVSRHEEVSQIPKYSEEEILHLIIDEIDQAQDILQLVRQLEGVLPIRSFKDLYKACDEEGKMVFRDTRFDLAIFEGEIPNIAFPIEDMRTLINRVGYLVRLVPPELGADPTKPENVKRRLQRQPLMGIDRFSSRNLVGGAIVGWGGPSTVGQGASHSSAERQQ